jgi:hypothetical protein
MLSPQAKHLGSGDQRLSCTEMLHFVHLQHDTGFRGPACPGARCAARLGDPPVQSLSDDSRRTEPGRRHQRESGGTVAEPLNLDLLRRLCAAPGIAGREDRVRTLVIDELRPLVDELRVDSLGSVVATKRGDGPRVMVAAHMDEIGFFVSHIDDRGFLRLQPVGGFDARVLVAQRVLVHGYGGSMWRGAVQPGTKPIHLLEKDEIKTVKMEELFVDVGLPVERVREEIEVGDIVTLDRELEPAGDCVMSKALDDRVGVFVMIEALRVMGETNAEIVAVATTQEEVGLRGAETAAFAVQPDIAVALDTTLACPAAAPTRGRCSGHAAVRPQSRCRSPRATSTPSTRWPTATTSAPQSPCWPVSSKTRGRARTDMRRKLSSARSVIPSEARNLVVPLGKPAS